MSATLEELKRKAQRATQGEWVADALGSEGYAIKPASRQSLAEDREHRTWRWIARLGWRTWEEDKANAEYIAAVSPAVVLALIAELEATNVGNTEQ